MEEIDKILERLPRDEGARRRVLEWIERTANDSTEELDDKHVAWSEQETESSEEEALAKRAKHQGFQPLSADSPKKYLRGRQPISAGLLTQRHNLLCQEGQDPISADPFSPQKHHPGDQLQMDQIQRGLLLEQSPVANGYLVDHDMLKVCPSDH